MSNRVKKILIVVAGYLSLFASIYLVIFTYYATAALTISTIFCAGLLYLILRLSGGLLALVLAAIPLLLSATCTFIDLKNSSQTHTEVETLYSGTMKRSFRYYRPAAFGSTSPGKAIIALHGFMQTAATMERLTGLNALAQKSGFLVIYPEGYRKSWNDGDDTKPATRENIDDIGFISTIIDTLKARYNIIEIYLTGFSNGGFLAVDAACQLANKIDGFAAVAAGTWEGNLRHCSEESPVRAIFIQMKNDPLTKWQRFGTPAEDYSKRIGCISEVDTTNQSNYQIIRYNCALVKSVIHVALDAGGHIWPGGPQYMPSFLIGSADVDFNASAFIVSEWISEKD